MKKLLLTAMVIGAILFSVNETKAQVRVGVNINIGGGRPSWGLPGNYAGDYYYIPEIDTYYDIPRRQFIYLQGDDWVFSYDLPYEYRGYDLNRGYKVIVNEPRPYLHANVYRGRYGNYYDNYNRQNVIIQRGGGYNNRYDNDRYNNGRDDRFEGRREDRNDRFENRGRGYERNDHNDRGRGNDHENGRGWGQRGRE